MGKKKPQFQRSSLKDHKQQGKDLVPPFNQLSGGMEQIFWSRDLLPEFLWIDALVQAYGQHGALQVFRDFLAAADPFGTGGEVLDGTMSAFRAIAASRRQEFVEAHAASIAGAVAGPLRSVLMLYQDCPMSWMVPGLAVSDAHEAAVTQVRAAVVRLFAGKDAHAAFCRAFPLQRYLAHGKVKIFSSLTETIKALKQYPQGDRQRAETFARNTHNMMFMQKAAKDPNVFAWARIFWCHNRRLAPCAYE